MRVLLLGGSGFIGRALAGRLVERGDTVEVAGRAGAIDPRDAPAVAAFAADRRIDAVVNLVGAGISHGSASIADMERANAEQPAAIAAALASLDRPVHLVHAASSTERLPGQDVDESEYSRTKHDGSRRLEELSGRLDWPLTIARIHNTYGPGQPATRFVAAVVAALRAGEPVVLAHPDRVRDFVYVDDVARSLVATLDEAAGGRPEIGTGTGTRLEAVARLVARTVGAPESLVVRGRPSDVPDLHLATVCPIPFGSFGLCRTVLPDGIRLMTEAR